MSTPENPFAAPEPRPPAPDGPPQQPHANGPPAYGQQPYAQQPYAQQPYAQQPYGPPYGAPGQPYGMGIPASRSTNGLAIASMVLGIVWLYWIGSILALVFGYIAKKQIRERGDAGGGMATAGIVLGWVGIGILTLFVVFAVAGAFDSGYETY